MKKELTVLSLATVLFAGCLGGGGMRGGQMNPPVYTAPSTSSTTVTNSVKNSLSYMYDEERLAHDVYLAIYSRQPVMQLQRIASRSEVRHISAVQNLARRYGAYTPVQRSGVYSNPTIQSLYNTLYNKGTRSSRDALEVGCMVEVTDIDDLDRYIYEAQRDGASDVVSTYQSLKKGSYNHYWAFDKGLKQMGVSSGCCSLGSKYCHPEYPQNARGGGHGQGRGRGQGMGMGRGRW